MLAVAIASLAWAPAPRLGSQLLGSHADARASSVRLDADRCFYGDVDKDGIPMEIKKNKMRTGPAPTPSTSMTPLDVVNAQFESLSFGTYTGIEETFAFLSPTVVEQYSMDLEKFKSVLGGDAFEGLVGMAEYTVLGWSEPADDVAIAKLRVLPKPIPGCVRTSGIADQNGITWPTWYKWHLRKLPADATKHAGCWMLENMQPTPPPIDVDASDELPAVEQAAA